jgi:hypothetical protein
MNNQSVVLSKISGVVSDITRFVTDIDHAGIDLTFGADDCIYIGSVFPFNTLYLRLGASFNNNLSAMAVAFWNANSFVDFIGVQDGTAVSGATLGQSGIINLLVQDNTSPGCHDSKYIDEISNFEGYYTLYWTRLKFSAAMDKINLKYVGQLFVEADAAIFKQYPDLQATQYKTVYGVGKTDFLDERVIASDLLVSDLIAKGQVLTGDQFLDWRLLKEPTLHKTAELVYKAQGVKYKDDMVRANAAYNKALDTRKFGISRSGDIRKDTESRIRAPKRFYR